MYNQLKRTIYQSPCGFYRVVEYVDIEHKFESPEDHALGAFGYSLEYWNPTPNHGWTHLDSTCGCIGAYHETDYNHECITEFKETITKLIKKDQAT